MFDEFNMAVVAAIMRACRALRIIVKSHNLAVGTIAAYPNEVAVGCRRIFFARPMPAAGVPMMMLSMTRAVVCGKKNPSRCGFVRHVVGTFQ